MCGVIASTTREGSALTCKMQFARMSLFGRKHDPLERDPKAATSKLRKSRAEKDLGRERSKAFRAMHYAASAGILVERENLKKIKPGVGFWPTVFECEKKGKINFEDLKLADRNVRRVTRWSDPVDNNTSFAEVVCDNYEALVEEEEKNW